jgi:thymidine phosphorylase
MFVFACSLKRLNLDEVVDYTRAMIETGEQLNFGSGPVVDMHCIGGVPGNRTTMVVVPILAALGFTVPKTSSRAITSPAGTADTMAVLADVSLSVERIYDVIAKTGACIAWGGALDLAPADDVLITVERPMELDAEPQMVASILAKKKSAGATHALIDIPVGRSAKVRTYAAAEKLAELFRAVAAQIGLRLEIALTDARGPIGRGIGPRLEALDVLAVLRRDIEASQDLREKSLYVASRILEMSGSVATGTGYREARLALDSGMALSKFNDIVNAQGSRELPAQAPYRHVVGSPADGRIREVDCWHISRVAKRAGAPANISAGVRMIKSISDVVVKAEPLFEIHSSSAEQLSAATAYAEAHAVASQKAAVFRRVNLRFDEPVQIVGPFDTGETAGKDHLCYALGGIHLGFQNVGLGRINQTQAEIGCPHLLGDSVSGSDEHLFGHPPSACCIDRQANRRENIHVITLSGDEGLVVVTNRWKRASPGEHSAAVRPSVGFLGGTLSA